MFKQGWLVCCLLLLSGCQFGVPLDPFYEAVLRAQPGHAGALYLQGGRLIDLGQFDDAEIYFARMTRVAPAEPTGWVGLGHAQLEQNKSAAAERSFRHALTLGGGTVAIQAELGLISALILQGRELPAEERLSQLEQRQGESASTRRLRGDLAFIRGDLPLAAEHYRLSLQEQPQQLAIRDRLQDIDRFLAVRGGLHVKQLEIPEK